MTRAETSPVTRFVRHDGLLPPFRGRDVAVTLEARGLRVRAKGQRRSALVPWGVIADRAAKLMVEE